MKCCFIFPSLLLLTYWPEIVNTYECIHRSWNRAACQRSCKWLTVSTSKHRLDSWLWIPKSWQFHTVSLCSLTTQSLIVWLDIAITCQGLYLLPYLFCTGSAPKTDQQALRNRLVWPSLAEERSVVIPWSDFSMSELLVDHISSCRRNRFLSCCCAWNAARNQLSVLTFSSASWGGQ